MINKTKKRIEPVRERKELPCRPTRRVYLKVKSISKQRGISITKLMNEIVEKGIETEGVNNAS